MENRAQTTTAQHPIVDFLKFVFKNIWAWLELAWVAFLGWIGHITIDGVTKFAVLIYTVYACLNQAYKFHTRKKKKA